METFLFILYGILAAGGALAVVLSQNVVRMAFYLVISLGSTAGLFFLLDADFVGATQLLIYVGGTVVLLIFGVMLTSSAPFQSMASSPGEILMGALVGLAFVPVVLVSVYAVDWNALNAQYASEDGGHGHVSAASGYNRPEEGNTARPIGTALLGMRFDTLSGPHADQSAGRGAVEGAEHTHVHANGEVHTHSHSPATAEPASLSSGYLLPFEIVSVHLLVVLVGAAYLARAKRRAPEVSST